jgi:hypothetical protein
VLSRNLTVSSLSFTITPTTVSDAGDYFQAADFKARARNFFAEIFLEIFQKNER